MTAGATASHVGAVYTVREISQLLRCAPLTVQWHIRRGELVAFRFGRGFRVQETDLQDFLDRQKQELSSSRHEGGS
jgi:excisionase family DNA binding protein